MNEAITGNKAFYCFVLTYIYTYTYIRTHTHTCKTREDNGKEIRSRITYMSLYLKSNNKIVTI